MEIDGARGPMTGGQNRREQLIRDGFCIFERIFPQTMIAQLGAASDQLLEALGDKERKDSGGQGSIVALPYRPAVFTDLITHPGSIDALHALGFDRPRYWSGYVIAREARSAAGYWHQDWPFWGDPVSGEEVPHQLFLMVYLTDTRPRNGCLRVIPGSHQHWVTQHDTGGHDEGTRHEDPAASPAYADSPDQIDVAITAGDLLIGDARILHAPHANQTDERRTVITMWYLPRFDELPEPMQAAFQSRLNMIPPSDLPDEQTRRIAPLNPDYSGDAESAEWDRNAGAVLKGR